MSDLQRNSAPPQPAITVLHVGRLMLISQAGGIPSDEEWDASLGHFAMHDLEQLRVMVLTEGGRPSPAQQARLAKALSRWSQTILVAVVSDSAVIRFTASALALLLRRIRVFRRSDLMNACRYLELNEYERRSAAEFVSGIPERASTRAPE